MVGRKRFLRGLVAGILIALVDIVGVFLGVYLSGGLGDWSNWEFAGIFGLFEIITGIAFIIGPNIWRLPVIEASTTEQVPVRLAVSTVFIAHWTAGLKIIVGLALLFGALTQTGAGIIT